MKSPPGLSAGVPSRGGRARVDFIHPTIASKSARSVRVNALWYKTNAPEN
jgi:hypothetical protein